MHNSGIISTGLDHGKPPPTLNLEVYGFALWIGTAVSYVIYLLWAFLPEPILHAAGVFYYPRKYWAIALPAFVCVAFLCLFLFYISFNIAHTNPLDSIFTLTDRFSRRLGMLQKRSYQDEFSIPDISDIPVETVNRLMFHSSSLNRQISN